MKNVAASVRQRLLNRSRETGDRFQNLLIRYGIERLLFDAPSLPEVIARVRGFLDPVRRASIRFGERFATGSRWEGDGRGGTGKKPSPIGLSDWTDVTSKLETGMAGK